MGKATVMHLGLRIRKLADKSTGERLERWDPETGEKYLLNPANGLREGWPLLGVVPEGDLPKHAVIPTSFVELGIRDGWITVEGSRIVTRPGGPEHDPWRVDPEKGIPHVRRHVDAIVLGFITGPARYVVTENPDKWHDGPPGEDRAGDPGAEVRNYYLATLED
jgi:hypothetical protein